jgi:ubiquinone/menaquinone biosynthesis C-methylase UbiE
MTLTIPEYDDPSRARGYGKRPGTTRAELRALRRLLGAATRGSAALDVPCGNGRLAGLLSELGYRFLLGLDGAPAMARAARPRYLATVAGDAARLPLPDRSVDLVLCVRLLHHFPEADARRAILGELSRVARRAVAFSYYRSGTLEGLRRRIRRKRPGGRFGLSGAAILADVRAAGLEPARSASLLPLIREQTFVLATVQG